MAVVNDVNEFSEAIINLYNGMLSGRDFLNGKIELYDETFKQIKDELTLVESCSIAIEKYSILGETGRKTFEQKIKDSKYKICDLISKKNKKFFDELGSEYSDMYMAVKQDLNAALGYKKIISTW